MHLGVKSVLHATRVHYTRRNINYSRESLKLITSSLISSSLNYQINYCRTYIGYLLKLIFTFRQAPSIISNRHACIYLVIDKMSIMKHPTSLINIISLISLFCMFLTIKENNCYSCLLLALYNKLFF